MLKEMSLQWFPFTGISAEFMQILAGIIGYKSVKFVKHTGNMYHFGNLSLPFQNWTGLVGKTSLIANAYRVFHEY